MTEDPFERALHQELRLALTINGGVSLAVWMGGVVNEIDRFRCAFSRNSGPNAPYAALLDGLETVVVTDVIAGTSAGGMNGALLAYVAANRKSLDCAGPGKLRATWQQLGSIERLLPTDGEPTSVLRGEEVLFLGCAEVFGALQAATPDLNEDASRWVRLTVTATDSHGYDVSSQGVTTPDHRLRMQFRQVERPDGAGVLLSPELVAAIGATLDAPVQAGATDAWPFPARTSPRDLDGANAAAYLARAARSTASFPIAFTPSELPLNHSLPPLDGGAPGDALTATPAMEKILETASPDAQLPPTGAAAASRYVVDGGVWDNSPFSAVLRSIDHMPAGRDVRRVLAYIVGTRAVRPKLAPIERPRLAQSLVQAVALPADLSFVNDLERIGRDRRRQLVRRQSVPDLLVADNVDPFALAADLYPLHRNRRLRDELSATYGALGRPAPEPPPDVPWLPPLAARLPGAEGGLAEWSATSADWRWGVTPARAAIQQARRMLRAVIRRLHPHRRDSSVTTLIERLIGARELLSQLTWALDDLTHQIEATQAAAPPAADLATVGWSDATRRVCGLVVADFAACVAALNAPLTSYRDSLPPGSDASTLTTAVGLTAGGAEMIVKRALAIEIVLGALSESDDGRGVDYSLTAIRPDDRWPVPGDEPPPGPARPPLAGASYQHFGGFFRSSWRVDDWMWGRLDGVTQMVELLLDQAQLTRLCGSPPDAANITELATRLAEAVLPEGAEGIAARVFEEACRARSAQPTAGGTLAGRRALVAAYFAVDIRDVLAAGQTPEIEEPRRDALRRLRADLARGLQLAILDEEIPILAAAAVQDGGAPVDVAELLASRDKGLRRLTLKPPGAPVTKHELHQMGEHAGANAAFALGHPYLGHTLRIIARCTGGWWSSRRAVRATSAYARRRGKAER